MHWDVVVCVFKMTMGRSQVCGGAVIKLWENVCLRQYWLRVKVS